MPQRKNPFLFNLLLATYLSTIPGSLLVYAGNPSGGVKVSWNLLCFVQAALIDGCPPLFGVAQLVLLYDTWSGVRASITGKKQTSRRATFMYSLLIAPYFATWIFVFASFIAAAQSMANHSLIAAYCQNYSGPSNRVRTSVGELILGIVLIEIGFCIAIGWTMLRNRKLLKMDPVKWRNEKHFVTRLFILNALQLLSLLLSTINIAGVNNSVIKAIYQLLTSMNALALFFVIGSQKQIVYTWIAIITRRKIPDFVETQATIVPELSYSDELVLGNDIEKDVTPTSQGDDVQAEGRDADKPNELWRA